MQERRVGEISNSFPEEGEGLPDDRDDETVEHEEVGGLYEARHDQLDL